MTKLKTQMRKEVVLAFNLPAKARQAVHLDFSRPCRGCSMKSAICHLDFDIWVYLGRP
jgi:hypothetical protein